MMIYQCSIMEIVIIMDLLTMIAFSFQKSLLIIVQIEQIKKQSLLMIT